MKIITGALIILAFCAGCQDSDPKDMDNYTMDYSISKNQFGVVVAQDDGISKEEAKKYAYQRAAEVAHEHGYQYFTIDQESQVDVVRSEEGSADQSVPRNLYYERIQSGNFARENIMTPEMPPSSQVPGYQIEFSCQESKPSGKYYDVCDFKLCD